MDQYKAQVYSQFTQEINPVRPLHGRNYFDLSALLNTSKSISSFTERTRTSMRRLKLCCSSEQETPSLHSFRSWDSPIPLVWMRRALIPFSTKKSLAYKALVSDNDWLYGGTPDQIKHSITYGRQAAMPGWQQQLKNDHLYYQGELWG